RRPAGRAGARAGRRAPGRWSSASRAHTRAPRARPARGARRRARGAGPDWRSTPRVARSEAPGAEDVEADLLRRRREAARAGVLRAEHGAGRRLDTRRRREVAGEQVVELHAEGVEVERRSPALRHQLPHLAEAGVEPHERAVGELLGAAESRAGEDAPAEVAQATADLVHAG